MRFAVADKASGFSRCPRPVSSEIPAVTCHAAGHPARTQRSIWERVLKPLAFVGVSGVGWLIDISAFLVLTELVGWLGSVSNAISSVLGIVFVFGFSHQCLFGGQRKDRMPHFLTYLLYQALLVGGVSFAIDAISQITGFAPIVAKLGLTPVTLALNYVVMVHLSSWRAVRPQ